MKANEILDKAIEKQFHKLCIDMGYTTAQIRAYDRTIHKTRAIIARKLYKAGFRQNLIARVMNRNPERISRILKGASNETKDL